jgi:hypothetical protein
VAETERGVLSGAGHVLLQIVLRTPVIYLLILAVCD